VIVNVDELLINDASQHMSVSDICLVFTGLYLSDFHWGRVLYLSLWPWSIR